MNYIIGKIYTVPCVVVACWNNACVPINGPAHEDAEIIGFPEDHWHIDWRFVSEAFYRSSVRFCPGPGMVHNRVISVKNAPAGVVMKRRKCRREMPEFPAVRWTPELEQKYAGTRLHCMKCPHRGISLEGVPVNSEGVAVCPGHGLAWHLDSGRLVIRGKPVRHNERA